MKQPTFRNLASELFIGMMMLCLMSSVAEARSWSRFFNDLGLSIAGATVTVGGTVTASTFGTSASGVCAGVVLGTAEAGGALAVGIFTSDPSDTINFTIQANESFLAPTCTPLDSASDTLNNAASAYVSTMSGAVQSLKNIQGTINRLAGTQLIRTPIDSVNQELWPNLFTQEAMQRLDQSNAVVDVYASLPGVEFPIPYNPIPSSIEVTKVIHREAAGDFPQSSATALFGTAFALLWIILFNFFSSHQQFQRYLRRINRPKKRINRMLLILGEYPDFVPTLTKKKIFYKAAA